MKRMLAIALVLSVMVSALLPPTLASAHTLLVLYPANVLTNEYHQVNGSCRITVMVTLQEQGPSGIDRLRIRFELRSPYDTGILPTYYKSGWIYSARFPDNGLSYWVGFPHTITVGAGNRYALWAVGIGERPAWWQRDAKVKTRVVHQGRENEVGCEHEPVLGG